MTKFAQNTSVAVSASKAEIERIVERCGAGQFMSGWTENQAMVAFAMQGRQARFILPMPDKDEKRFTTHSRGRRTPEAALKEWEQACRQRWRALALVIKAKLEAVESGISVFDAEFMANIVLPNGLTVSEDVLPKIKQAYSGEGMPSLLPDYSKATEK